jgi:phage shock protein PspC (stress-responsive transcriptional regulator)
MEKTIKINLGGILFQIEEEAYRMLRDYLQSIDNKFRNVPGGNETIEDIESRIAEIFQSQKDLSEIISKENVEMMISIIGTPDEFDQYEGTESGYQTSHREKRMYRNPDDRIIGGVCGGIGSYLNTDPVWFRLIFIIMTPVFLIGLFVYLALWIALPLAISDSQKREMYGSNFYRSGVNITGKTSEYPYSSKVGSAFNQVFRAIGKVLFIIVRIFLIIIGVTFVLAGFTTLFSFIIIFVFKYPGSFSIDAGEFNLAYLPDFLNYIVTPAMVPLMTALIVLAVAIPLLAMVYGGIRLIFWFKVRDGYVWLIGLVVWVLCVASLAIISFNEGVSYAERGKTTSLEYFGPTPDTLYIMAGEKISDLHADKEIAVTDNYYRIYIDDENDIVYIRPGLNISSADNDATSVEIKRQSSGTSRLDAIDNAERLKYNFTIKGDTLLLDEFFMIPPDTKWSFDEVSIKVFIPEGTIICMDKTIERMYHSYYDYDFVSDSENRFWRMTEDGIDYNKLRHINR